MQQLNKIFKNNENLFNIIVKKIEIIQKSKDSLNNKYKTEKKQFIERIYSMQQQIDYLNGKIRENDIKINILQSQLNENNIAKKQLLKKVKILSSGLESIDYSDNNINIDNVNNNNKNEDNKSKKEINKETNIQNYNVNIKKLKLNGNRRQSFANASIDSSSMRDNNVENSDNIKDQKNNNNNSFINNEGKTILEENVSDSSSKRRNINDEDDSDKNCKSFCDKD